MKHFLRVFPGKFAYWSLHASFNAAPSLVIALLWLGLYNRPEAYAAMFWAIFFFIVLYATLTSLPGPLGKKGTPLAEGVRIGAKIRLWIAVISTPMALLPQTAMFTPDYWCGLYAINIVNMVHQFLAAGTVFFNTDQPRGFFPIFITTVTEGLLLSGLLFMFCFASILIRTERHRKDEGRRMLREQKKIAGEFMPSATGPEDDAHNP